MSDRRLRIAMIVLCVVGVGVAGYLTVTHYAHITVACAATGNPCETVQHSAYSDLAGIPVALLGLLGYITFLGLLIFAAQDDRTRAALLSLVLIGFGFSAYLTYRELFTIHAICEWCVSSAVIMTILAGVAAARFVRGADANPDVPVPAPDSVGSSAAHPAPAA